MRFADRTYITVAYFLPRVFRDHMRRQLGFAGVPEQDEDIYVGASTLLALLCPLIGVMVGPAMGVPPVWWHVLIGLGLGIIIELILYLAVYFKTIDRAKKAEEALPDMLHIVASNLRAGLTPFNAIKNAQRKEFGPLAVEIRRATEHAFSTKSFSEVLLCIRERIDSETLDRTLRLLSSSMAAGGHVATLLEELARDILESKQLKNEFVAATKTYSLFIFFTVVIGAPFLLNIAIQFVKMIAQISSKTKLGTSSALGMGFFSGDLPVTTTFIFWLSISMLVITSLLASLLMSVIKEGRIKDGFRTAPLVAIASLTVFFIAGRIMAGFF